MSVFFTDTDCEMNYTDAEELGMHVIGMPYTIKNKEYVYDYGKNIDIKQFYEDMRAGEIATTSALNSQDYIDYFEPIFAAGEDILYVHFSSELSATFDHMQTALDILKEKYPERKVTTFDTGNICVGAGIQAIEACKLHNAGASDEEVIEFLKEFKRCGFGVLITSDCHDGTKLDLGREDARQLLLRCGFKEQFILTDSGFEPIPL